jgi:hypothetical protein
VPKIRKDDDTPKRRRGAAAAAVADDGDERGLAMRLLLHSPRDLVAAMFASSAVIAIVSNAMFMQAGHHPSPMFGGSVAAPPASVVALPRPRPLEAEARPDSKAFDQQLLEPAATELKPAETRPVEPRRVEIRPAEPKRAEAHPVRGRSAETEPNDPLANLVRSTVPASATTSAIPRPPAAIPQGPRDSAGDAMGASRRVAAVQRALTDYGYGQLKPTGTVGSDTQAAIQRFERARHIPVTGQMSDRLVRELSAMIGRPID